MDNSVKAAINNFAKEQVKTAKMQAEAHADYYKVLFNEIQCLETQLMHSKRALEQEKKAHGKVSVHAAALRDRIKQLTNK